MPAAIAIFNLADRHEKARILLAEFAALICILLRSRNRHRSVSLLSHLYNANIARADRSDKYPSQEHNRIGVDAAPELSTNIVCTASCLSSSSAPPIIPLRPSALPPSPFPKQNHRRLFLKPIIKRLYILPSAIPPLNLLHPFAHLTPPQTTSGKTPRICPSLQNPQRTHHPPESLPV